MWCGVYVSVACVSLVVLCVCGYTCVLYVLTRVCVHVLCVACVCSTYMCVCVYSVVCMCM